MTDEDIENARPIIIKRVKRNNRAEHTGSWKVAFADFATALMAFFLLLWLMGNTNKEEKKAISGYFNDPSGFSEKHGASASPIGEGGVNAGVIEQKHVKAELKILEEIDEELSDEALRELANDKELVNLNLLKNELENLVDNSNIFSEFKDQVIMDITSVGLRIQIIDKDKRPMFDSGSAEPRVYSKVIIRGLAEVLKQVPNKISITGHTDAAPYVERENYSNWELSTERANAARRELIIGGISDSKIARIEGFSSSLLFDPKDQFSPSNRRIGIIVLKQSALDDIRNQVLGVE